mgnify:CR=1 FL=1
MITPRIREICRMHLRGDLAYEKRRKKHFSKEEVKVEQVNYSNQYDLINGTQAAIREDRIDMVWKEAVEKRRCDVHLQDPKPVW